MPYNLALHEFLLSLGYIHEAHDEDWEDTGNGETGPMIHGYPAWDEYTGPDERVFFTSMGVADRELRDLEFEKFVAQNQGS